jgi:hypothetical protein
MRLTVSTPRSLRSRSLLIIALASLAFIVAGAVMGGRGAAQEVLTNDSVVTMVKAGLSESVIVQKIRTSPHKFDTSTAALIQLKNAGVPDRVIEAMSGPAVGAPAANPATADPGAPVIAHMSGGGQKVLKPIYGVMQFKAEPFAGTRQEVVLPTNRAEYRIADTQPVFVAPEASIQWILARLKPGKKDRNLPIGKGTPWYPYSGFATRTFSMGVDPKYAIQLAGDPRPQGGVQLKPIEPLKPGEYGFVAVVRGQPNLNEVFDFAVE